MGKKLKKGPESYEDVKDAVIKDYQAVYQDAWLKDLKRKYKVEINQEVLKQLIITEVINYCSIFVHYFNVI